jgi:DNA invertase Pin-like site-specific DNA recombinase
MPVSVRYSQAVLLLSTLIPGCDPAYLGGTMERPALQRLLADIEAGKVDTVVVYKIDRLTRSLTDFSRMIEVFERHGVSFVSVTQQFNTTTSMGRLILNILLSFAPFEREVMRSPVEVLALQLQREPDIEAIEEAVA